MLKIFDGDQESLPLLLCFSHLRWNFVYQRPQHLMTRFAREYQVVFIEEPVVSDLRVPFLETREESGGVCVLVPHLGSGLDTLAIAQAQRHLLDQYLSARGADPAVLWYYTPMSLAYSEHLQAPLVIYDCMDELSAFRGAPPALLDWEQRLLARADAVFTGGYSLYEAKCDRHPEVYPFPSSVDVAHFAQARGDLPEPADQAGIPHPRLGFYGVLDERLDVALLGELAAQRPDWHFVLVGPVVKIAPEELPQVSNIHYLGGKSYEELPAYLGGWDVALMLFALNDSTRYISPTKTPEYLAGGRMVVSSPIVDVVRTYGDSGVVAIAQGAADFTRAIEAALQQSTQRQDVWPQMDDILEKMSWDTTWQDMKAVMTATAVKTRQAAQAAEAATARLRLPKLPAWQRASYDYLVVGAGFAGSVLAERLAVGLGKRVLVIDRRPHIAGNAYDFYNADGLLVHQYGPHIFHTNAQRVVDYLSGFTVWLPYEHRVLAHVDEQLVPIPINLDTLSTLYGRSFTAEEAEAFLAAQAEPVFQVKTSEDVVVGTVGRELYEKFFRGYTRKQWDLDPSQLDKSVTARVPTRTNHDDRYFTDTFQCMPAQGYTRMFERMLDHPNITVATGVDFAEMRDVVNYQHLIFCGPIDEYFNYCFGRLPYRSLRFQHLTLEQEQFQPVGVVNYPSEAVPYTRITEYKHLTGQVHGKTSLTYEFPSAEGDPYYPVPRPENAALYRRYQELADSTPGVTFVGRLGTYRYYNMDQIVAQALTTYAQLVARAGAPQEAPPTESELKV